MLSCVAVACVFCHRLTDGDLLAENTLAAAFADAFPLSSGHCLVVPRRHEPDFFALTTEEQTAILALLGPLRSRIERENLPEGYKELSHSLLKLAECGGSASYSPFTAARGYRHSGPPRREDRS